MVDTPRLRCGDLKGRIGSSPIRGTIIKGPLAHLVRANDS
jgi:hypothetical protein